jgi:hypothetical protein
MKSLLRFASITPHTTLVAFLLGILPMAACNQSNSVGGIGDSSAAAGSPAGSDGGVLPAGGATTSGAAGAVGGGTTAPAGGSGGGAGKGGGQAGANGGGQAGASGGSAVDAGVDRYQCPPISVACPDGLRTDAYIDARGCTVCPSVGSGGSAVGGTTAKGGAGGTRVDAAVDGHVCPPLTDVYCTNYTTDAYGCTVCASTGTGGAAGGTSGKGGTGGTTGVAGASGSGGTSAPTCQRRTADDSQCRSLNYPPLAFFCRVPALPPSNACKMYNGIDSGDFVCCPDPYLACPDSPPTQASACTGTSACTYGSHPDPTCRTSATCTNGTWQVRAPAARCSEAQLPATCPTSTTTGSACSNRGLGCAYADGKYCICNNCSVEDPSCAPTAPDMWRCWSPPGGDCPTYYPNLGSTCSLPANTRCRYTCAANTTCSAAGAWVDGGFLCPG